MENKIIGQLTIVKNIEKPKLSNAKNEYITVLVKDVDGKTEKLLFFTERELKIAEVRAEKGMVQEENGFIFIKDPDKKH